ncbi:uncharacterized protein LOC110170370 [Boleophthalmus pectinirostris]|uniref:uncharacterized protein LOC110170370 n=1 Tax=Boleophthalmus pectinirostris TaxID=150288 RepID=UPI00242E82AB|nr:uncharacterized protein LOC110170370 [Boleophthalmus pectinirostris]
MITRSLLLLVSLCVWEGLLNGATSSKIARRRGVGGSHMLKLGDSRAADQWESSVEALPVVTLRNLVSHEQESEETVSYAKILQSHATSADKDRQLFKPKREVDWHLMAASREVTQEMHRLRNNTKNVESKSVRPEKTYTIHHKQELHSNKTRFKTSLRTRIRPELSTGALPGKAFSIESNRKINLTGSYEVLKLLSKENLVRIVNSQMQSVPSLSFPSKGSRSRKRDLIDVNHGQSDAQKPQRQDIAVTQTHSGLDNQTAFPYASPVPTPLDHNRGQSAEAHVNPLSNRDNLGDTVASDSRSKHLVSLAQIEVNSPKKEVMIDRTEPPFTSTKHLPQFVPSETNAPSVLTMQPQGLRPGNRAADSHRDPLAESIHFANMELSTAQYPKDEDSKLVNSSDSSSHVLRLHPAPSENRNSKEAKMVEPQIQENGVGLVFEELEEEEGTLGGISEGKAVRSRSRRSWIWNQFFVIEEYAGPEPVLIGRLHTDMDRNDGRTKYVLRGEGAGSVFVIDEKTGNIHVTKPLDREEKDEYRLIATATDRQTDRALEPSSQFIIRVQDINDNPPVFDQGPYIATVPEMENIGTSIIQVTATDADDPTYGNSAKLVYTLVQGQQYFSVDPQTGILRTAVPDMDRERQDTYLVVLQAKDMGGHLGGLSGTTTVTVKLTDVNDSPPRFTQSTWSFSVSELAIPGAEIGRISATDADLGENARLVYTILDGESGDTFNITAVNQEAVITLNKPVDYESRSSYSFSVEVMNPIVDPRFLRLGAFKDRATVRVAVLDADEPPKFSRSRYLMDVSENCPPACTVGRVSAIDPDTGLTNNISTDESVFAIVLALRRSISTQPIHLGSATLARLQPTVSALSLSLRRQKRDSLSPLEEDDVRENIITYDDEGGGEADTAAFDIAALQSAPHSSRTRGYRTLDSRNIRYAHRTVEKGRTYSWAQNQGLEQTYSGPGGPLYGRLCYSSATLPVLRRTPGGAFEPGLAELGYRYPGGQPDHSLVIQNQAAMVGPMESGAVYMAPTDLSIGSRTGSREGTAPQSRVSTSDGGTPRTSDSHDRGGGTGTASNCTEASEDKLNGQDMDWIYPQVLSESTHLPSPQVQSESLPREQNLVMTRSGSMMGQGCHGTTGGWVCDSATLPLAGRRASRAGMSPKRSGSIQGETEAGGGTTGEREGPGQRDYPGTLGRGGLEMGSSFVVGRGDREGGISLSGTPTGFPEGFIGDWRDRVGIGGYVVGRRDMSPQLLPLPRGGYPGVLGAAWATPGVEAVRGAPGGPSLALRVGEFLRLRLAQVTFDPSQPPYDSVQVYGLEGTGSRAGSLSSLESDADKDGDKDDWGAGMEEWGPQFENLAQLFKEREKEKEEKEKCMENANEDCEKKEGGHEGKD